MNKRKLFYKFMLITALLFLWHSVSWGCDSVMSGTYYRVESGFLSPVGGETSSSSYQIIQSSLEPIYLLASACLPNDVDCDGWTSDVDCNDHDLSVNPAATEIVNNGKNDDCNPATPVATSSGNGYNYPAPSFRASLSLSANASSLGTSWLKYYYAKTRMSLISTSITGVTATGGIATVTGVGTVNNVPGCTFTATVTDSSTDSIGIVIAPGGACATSYSTPSQAISSGSYAVVGQ